MPLLHFLQKAGKWMLVIGNRLANMQLIPSIFHVFDVQFKYSFLLFWKGSVEQCARTQNFLNTFFPNLNNKITLILTAIN